MINSRIVELLKAPELVSQNDLPILESEINKFPYIQSLRSLYLYGIHQFVPTNYQKELSKTAAYTTDKKILYQFINKEKFESVAVESIPTQENVIEKEETFDSLEQKSESKNRILFEGETDLLNQNNSFTEVPDAETYSKATIVSEDDVAMENLANLVSFQEVENFAKQESESEKDIQTDESEVLKNNKATEFSESVDAENFSKEEIVSTKEPKVEGVTLNEVSFHEVEEFVVPTEADSDKNDAKTVEVKEEEHSSELSFHGISDFMSEVNIQSATQLENFEPQREQKNRHEDEMQRLLAEVEAKMKANKKPEPKIEEEPVHNFDVNFGESYDSVELNDDLTGKNTREKIESQPLKIEDEAVFQDSTWKPMNLAQHAPDSVISEVQPIKVEVPAVEIPKDIVSEIKEEERPVFNVSFLSNSDAITPKENEGNTPETIIEEEQKSNVSQFINTWQSWLKIDHQKEVENPIVKEEVKEKAIEKFIETEPKISQLRDESSYVVKEKSGDISHLMTETLANLYVMQRLYSKAIKAFETLKEKHPEKKEYFSQKIEEIKDLRSNNK